MTVTAVDERLLLELQAIAGIPNLPTQDTYWYRMALSGEGPHAYDWSDKPHRLVFDLCRLLEAQTSELLAARQEIAGLREGLANSEARARELEGAIGDRTEIPESPAARKAMLAYYRRMVELYEATK